MSKYDFIFFNPDRMSIDRCRNQAAEIASAQKCKYILFLDDDVLVPINGLEKLIQANADIIAGNVFIRGYPFKPMSFKWVKSNLKNLTLKEVSGKGVIPVAAVGFSFCLIKVDLLKKIEKPYFITGPVNTEDIYFCVKAAQAKKDVLISLHLDVPCQHILWEETIGPWNVKEFKRYYERVNPQLKPIKTSNLSTNPHIQVRKGVIEYEDLVKEDAGKVIVNESRSTKRRSKR